MEFDHYLLRPIRQQDAEQYFQLVETNRKRLEDFFAGTVAKTQTLADTGDFIAANLKKTEARSYYPFVVIDRERQHLIGFVDVKNIDWNIPKAEIGCFIDQHYAGKSISEKALKLVIDLLFNEMGFSKLFLRTHQRNKAAQRLAERCGFEVEGTIRRDYRTTKGELVDLIYYGLINTDV